MEEVSIITKEEQDFIINHIDNGKELLQKKEWNEIINKLKFLEFLIGYTDVSGKITLNDTGLYIQKLIDKTNLIVQELNSINKFKKGLFTTTEKFETFLHYVKENKNKSFVFYYGTTEIKAKFDTMYECCDYNSDTDEVGNEDFFAIVFCNIETNQLFEINYKNLPDAIYCDGERIILKN